MSKRITRCNYFLSNLIHQSDFPVEIKKQAARLVDTWLGWRTLEDWLTSEGSLTKEERGLFDPAIKWAGRKTFYKSLRQAACARLMHELEKQYD